MKERYRTGLFKLLGLGRILCGIVYVDNTWDETERTEAETWWYGAWGKKTIDWWWGEVMKQISMVGWRKNSHQTYGTGSED